MGSRFVDTDSLVFPTGEPMLSAESGAALCDGAFIIVTQAFCPAGHDLVAFPGPLFDGFPGISVRVKVGDGGGIVTLSPMHGDERKEGGEVLVDGERCELFCPVCDEALPVIGPCDCGSGMLHSVNLVPRGDGEIAAICDLAGCRRSRVANGLDVLAAFED